jgi:sodium pump decarboxylase gamma subunit
MSITELMGLFSNPETIKTLSGGDRMMGVGVTVILGMGITVLALIFIMFLIEFMTIILAERPKSIVVEEKVTKNTSEKDSQDDEELIAVIAAAIAAKLKTSVNNIKITNIKKNKNIINLLEY